MGEKISFNDLLTKICEFYHININMIQYHLIGTTLKSFITKLYNDKKILIEFDNGTMTLKKNTNEKL